MTIYFRFIILMFYIGYFLIELYCENSNRWYILILFGILMIIYFLVKAKLLSKNYDKLTKYKSLLVLEDIFFIFGQIYNYVSIKFFDLHNKLGLLFILTFLIFLFPTLKICVKYEKDKMYDRSEKESENSKEI